ncbi:unnamed protein product [Miscanthus lutarioriparius]|uniref:Methionyl-tRNA synthetase n=1 Tax=Miscanthus lutarioriparius TaxID=422564 RepID=A0A811PGK8_9POAL|nr:unnamed protein product [Miscanthus lutarioriparius]
MASSSPPPKLPIPGRRNILITSALPYVNNVPHLGNIIGSSLALDVFAACCKQSQGYNALYILSMFVEGTCPIEGCTNKAARGDQCDNCSHMLNPTDLIDPKCKVCKNTPHIRETDHLFLDLPLLEDKLVNYINDTSVAGMWSQNAIQATNAWLKEGLKSRCITRDLKWGVPVPIEKYKDKFDAPIGYVSITASYTPEWEKWWKNPDNVELFQFMGKDNVPFHTIMFPSTLLGTGENWTMMKTISVTEYLNYEGGKFSKSKGIGVFGNDAKDTNIPPEVWRYYLLMNRPEASDTLFTWTDLQAKLNSELLNNLGNFINRVLSFIAKPAGAGYDSIIPDAPGAESHPSTSDIAEKVSKSVEQYLDAMEKVKLKQGLKSAMGISTDGNRYLQDSEFWKLYKDNPANCAIVMKTSVGLVYLLACLLEPFMPSFSKEKDEKVSEHREAYAGSQAERSSKAVADAEATKIANQLNSIALSDCSKRLKKEQKKKPGNSKSKVAEAELSVAKLEIRVGLIRKAEKHPDADSLYVEEIDVGEEAPRTVVSGLVKYIPLEEMQNRKVCVLCNLKPVVMRGIKSRAMVLAASNEDHTSVELVEPPADAAVGERVTFAGHSGEPEASQWQEQGVGEASR